MSRNEFSFRPQFNWRVIFLRILANGIALALTAILVPKIYFVNRTLVDLLVLALALGIFNALIRPIIQFLTFRFIFATAGLVVILINALFLWLLSYLFPARFSVSGIFWPLVGGAIIGIIGSFLENLLGVTRPIILQETASPEALSAPAAVDGNQPDPNP